MKIPSRIEEGARRRVEQARRQIEHSLKMAQQRTPLAAEWDSSRLHDRLQAKAMLSGVEATAVAAGIRSLSRAPELLGTPTGRERIYGDTIDFVGVSFLERGVQSARAVGRVAFRDGSPQGTGFMVSDRLFLTNNHVISSPQEAARFAIEFDYELDLFDNRRDGTRFLLDPGTFFLTNHEDDLDYTLIAIGVRDAGANTLEAFGWCGLSAAPDKHALGEFANIVQHPDGRYKEVVLRENRLASRLETVLHYVADTEPGSSGSPVFNSEWQVIALHHWGGPWRQKSDDSGRPVPEDVNEGIRTSAIVADLLRMRDGLTGNQRALLDHMLRIGESAERPRPRAATETDGRSGAGPRISADGQVTWQVPIEISVRLPGIGGAAPAPLTADQAGGVEPAGPRSAERAVSVDPDYDNRPGYDPDFIKDFSIPLPALSTAQKKIAAKNIAAEDDEDPYELKYQHFSIVLNKVRKLAFFTACNINGRTSKSIDRKTGKVTPRKPGDGEAFGESAEASETWFVDPRLEPDAVVRQELYASQKVPGFKVGSGGWMSRMFQRGHMVRRTDPAWSTEKRALRADADTFHFTNCAPQVGAFNQGNANWLPNSGDGRLWRALEDYVLDNAVNERQRVSVFTGPVLAKGDPLWRDHIVDGFRAPMRFWKIVVWAHDGDLRATAMIADQTPAIDVMPERLDERAEDFLHTATVEDFLTTVAYVENETGLDFGQLIRGADIHQGESLGKAEGGVSKHLRRVTKVEELGLDKRPRRVRKRRA